MGLLAAVFDTNFDQLISRRLLGVVYAIALGVHLLAGVVAAVALVVMGGAGAFMGLIAVPIVTLLGALLLRLVFEAAVVYFRIAEDVRALRATPAPVA